MSPAQLPVALLAGGLATRLRPITEKVPSCSSRSLAKPFFSHQLRLLKKAGLTHLVLCIGYLGEKIVELYGDGSKWGVKIEYSFDGPKLLGTGGALIQALPKLGEAFYVLYGDSYLPIDYLACGEAFRRSGRLGLMTVYENHERYDAAMSGSPMARSRSTTRKPRCRRCTISTTASGYCAARALDGWPRDAVVDLRRLPESSPAPARRLRDQGALL